jgi:asparagine synthase (glutamine-hydrolysing)
MCGIAGWYSPDRWPGAVDAMIGAMAHRGPDDAGVWSAANVVLGHCRLAVIDPQGGRQPMRVSHSDGSNVVVCFGGEIYNYRHLRAMLLASGRQFRTASDTEVVGHAYLEWGTDAFRRLRGMFAVALYDERTGSLILCRDQLGIKPLYFRATPSSVVFGSELRGLFAGGQQMQIDLEGVCELLGLWPYRSPQSGILRGVEELQPGAFMVVGPEGRSTFRYWELVQRDHLESLQATVERVRSLLDMSVREQLVSDVPLTVLLSGGIDSSAVTALAAQHWRRSDRLRAYTLELPESAAEFVPSAFRPDLDAPFAAQMAEHTSISLTRVTLADQDVVDSESATTAARDMPDNGDMDTTLNALFARVARDYKVCLTGEGADEIFGGYPWAAPGRAQPLTMFPWLDSLCFPAEFIAAHLRTPVREFQSSTFATAIAGAPIDPQQPTLVEARERLTSYLDIAWFLPGQLERMDRISMWNSVEARVPFCSPELVEYCWSIPGRWKHHGRIEKGLLRLALGDILPDQIRHRRKTSYPTANGKKYEGHLRTAVASMLEDKHWPLVDLIDAAAIREVLEGKRPSPASRPSIWLGQLWSLYRWATHYSVEFLP